MNESKLEIFLAKMEVAASDDPMMQRWIYATKVRLVEQDERIIRLCKYPDMIPDGILVDYAQVLLASLGRLRRADRLRGVVSHELRDRVLDIAGRLDKNEPGTYRLSLNIRDEVRLCGRIDLDDKCNKLNDGSWTMNDESKKNDKKLALFNKLMDHEAGYPFTIGEVWVAAFKEMLRIIGENAQLEGYDRDNALDYVRRAIYDELGEAGNTARESFSDYTTRRAWEVVMPTKQTDEDHCECRHEPRCSDQMKDRCRSDANLDRIERLKSRDRVLAEARKKAADYAALPQAAAKFYGVPKHGDKR